MVGFWEVLLPYFGNLLFNLAYKFDKSLGKQLLIVVFFSFYLTGDPNAPEANMSFREHQEYFGPDVLVIIGLVMACIGAILTLISFYCEFKHPAIQATMAGIGPSLVGIGMLFCVLRLFFCTFCISKTCCECIADGLRFLILRCPCFKYFRKVKKQIHPLHVKDIPAQKPLVNGQAAGKSLNSIPIEKGKQGNGVKKNNNNNNTITNAPSSIEMTTLRMDPIHEIDERKSSTTPEVTEVRVDSKTSLKVTPKEHDDDEILKDEIDLLDEMKSQKTISSESPQSLHNNINELVLKTTPRY